MVGDLDDSTNVHPFYEIGFTFLAKASPLRCPRFGRRLRVRLRVLLRRRRALLLPLRAARRTPAGRPRGRAQPGRVGRKTQAVPEGEGNQGEHDHRHGLGKYIYHFIRCECSSVRTRRLQFVPRRT